MMSGGGVARMFTGGDTAPDAIIRNVLAQNPDATMVDFLQAGLTEEQAKAYYHLINPSMLDRARSKAPFGPPASEIYPDINLTGIETMVNESDRRRLEQIRSGEKYAQRKAAYDARNRGPVVNDPDAIDFAERQLDILEDPSLLITDEERALNTEDALNQRFDQAQQLARRLQAQRDQRLNEALILSPEDRALTEKDFADIARMQRPLKQRLSEFGSDQYDTLKLGASTAFDLAGEGIDQGIAGVRKGIQLLSPSVSNLYDDVAQLFSGPDTDVSGIVAADSSPDRKQEDAVTSVVPAVQSDNKVQENLGLTDTSGLVPNTSEISKYLDLGPEGAVRAGGDDAMLPSGPERASSALNELKDLINKQSKFASSANRGAALVALGTGIMEGKTAEGGRAAAKILSDDAKTQGALQLEGAKIAAADERERNRLAVMREDLQNKLGISQNASNRTALAEVNRALAEYDGFTIRGIADKIAKGMPLTPEESMYMTLQKAQQMLIPIVAPATRGLFANAGNQQPPPTGGSMKIVSKTT
jgi:hypothetical protein